MSTRWTRLGCALAATLATTVAVAGAGERKVAKRDVPQAVVAAVASRYPTGRQVAYSVETDHGTKMYEVKVVDGAIHAELEVTPAGKIHAEETTLEPAALPDAVRRAVAASAYKDATVTRAEKVVTDGNEAAPSYELLLVGGGKTTEVLFDKDGKILKSEATGRGGRD